MPVFTVNTNVKKIPANFKQEATKVIAETLSKPVSYIAIHVNAGQDICWGGTDEPTALCDLVSIGQLSRESNKKHSKVLMEFLDKNLGVKSDRIYITFRNKDKADIGYQCTTFDDLM